MKNNNTILHQRPWVKSFIRSGINIILGLCIILILGCGTLYLFQDKLIFMQREISEETLNHIRSTGTNVKEINLKMQDGTSLHGWFVKNSNPQKSKLLIYFGANAEEVSYLCDEMKRYKDWSVVLLNYRGYGLSEGNPSEEHLYSDALEIYDYFSAQSNVDRSNIVVMGRSLGTGVATYLAENRNVKGLILVTPYDNLKSLIQKKAPMLPLGFMLKYRFDSLARAPLLQVPLHIITASEDKIIPPWHSEQLAAAWGGKAFIHEIQGEDHNSLRKNDKYWDIIKNSLENISKR